MTLTIAIYVVIIRLVAIIAKLAIHVINQYKIGVVFRLGRVIGVKKSGLVLIIPVADRLTKVSMQIITLPIHS